ncbi:hypothetical protein ACFWZY_21355 [Streptomyces sp. NPDC058992]|uniref:hypothetical protein n=1 Tax=Streptomyces sp. NPDC058992 TaxID=3346688 RepID=UPI00369E8EBA
MSENKKPLTPEQQQAEDATQIRARFGATDAFERFATIMDDIGLGSGSGPGGFFGRTDFEARQLNEMLDLVENSNPADLESAGEALVKAKNALNKAAKELADYVGRVEWKGEAATEFKRFGDALAKHAYALATFANAAGTQMTVASTGLTSVRNSMPRERDSRLVAKRVEDFALTPNKENNPEYMEAVKVEKNRQEAINQMNRLASFYAVSEESLAAQEAPTFPKALSADVPRPTGVIREDPSSGAGAGAGSGGGSLGDASLRSAAGGSANGTSGPSLPEALGTAPPVKDRNTAMEIDSVATPAAPTVTTGGTPPSPATGTPSNSSGPLPSVPTAFGTPARGTSPRATGTPGVPRAGSGPGANAVGRPSATGSGAPATGRAGAIGRPGAVGSPTASGTQGTLGRPSGPMGTGGTAGRAGAAGASGQGPVVGRPGAAGQSAVGRTSQAPSAGGRAGHSNGVIGGTPQRPVSGNAGSRMPKGTVIGAETSAQRGSAARPGQSGVIGSGAGNAAHRAAGKGAPTVNGVVGMPRNGVQGTPRASGPAPGVRAGQRQSENQDQERDGSSRPDYLTEDEQTWKAQRRGAVPPVID